MNSKFKSMRFHMLDAPGLINVYLNFYGMKIKDALKTRCLKSLPSRKS